MRKRKNTGILENFIDNIEGDKVVWIIVLVLAIFSTLTIFSSTTLLTGNQTDRLDIITEHVGIAALSLIFLWGIYKFMKIEWIRGLSSLGFIFSLILLVLLLSKVDISGVIKSQEINWARRTLLIGGRFQLHVFEVTKIAMTMYMAWAIYAFKEDEHAARVREKSRYFRLANRLSKNPNLSFLKTPFWKRVIYMYLPTIMICGMILPESNSSAILLGAVLMLLLIVAGMPKREIFSGIICASLVISLLAGIHLASDRRAFADSRIETLVNRITENYDEDRLVTLIDKKTAELKLLEESSSDRKSAAYRSRRAEIISDYDSMIQDVKDKIRQPFGAKIAVHEGGIKGKGSGNSTQKYVVSNIYGDYMFSFILEEYGFLGGLLVIILYVSLMARGSMIARHCDRDEYAKYTVGGLTLLITTQAFLHMAVCTDLGPMTGQTLPMLSHGSCAFLAFCIAFGVILRISRTAHEKTRQAEEEAEPLYESNRDDIQASMDILEGLDS